MTSLRIFGAALVLSAIAMVPVSAQQAIDEPGAYSFYHPNNDALNGGAPTPAAGMSAQPPRGAMASTILSTKSRRVSRTSIRHY